MPPTVRWARVTVPGLGDRDVLSFGFRQDLVDAVKMAAPGHARRWDPMAKMWVVDTSWTNLVLDKLKSLGARIEPDRGLAKVFAARTKVDADVEAKARAAADGAPCSGPAEPRCTCSSNTSMGPKDHRPGCPFFIPPRKSPWRETVFEGSWKDFEQFMRGVTPGRGAARPSPPPSPFRRGMQPSEEDYRVLGVAQSADLQAVKAAHRRLALENHPDRGGDTQKLARINVARDRVVFALGQR